MEVRNIEQASTNWGQLILEVEGTALRASEQGDLRAETKEELRDIFAQYKSKDAWLDRLMSFLLPKNDVYSIYLLRLQFTKVWLSKLEGIGAHSPLSPTALKEVYSLSQLHKDRERDLAKAYKALN